MCMCMQDIVHPMRAVRGSHFSLAWEMYVLPSDSHFQAPQLVPRLMCLLLTLVRHNMLRMDDGASG